MNDTSDRTAPFQLKGGSFTMMVLKLIEPEHENFFPQLASKIRQAPSLFKNAPVVLDIQDLASAHSLFDFSSLERRLREHALIPIGVQGGTPELQQAAVHAGLSLIAPLRATRLESDFQAARAERAEAHKNELRTDARSSERITDPRGLESRAIEARTSELRPSEPKLVEPKLTEARAPEEPGAETRPPESRMAERPTMMVTEPVRSGRRIYAPKGDLIVLAPVSPGAELLADGHIHIYSSLRGRALAGLKGDRTARIFCHSLEAELVSIAGLYRVSEDIEAAVLGKSVQIFLEADRLRMEALS